MQLCMVMMWRCPNCKKTRRKKPERMKCRSCGLVLASEGTQKKHKILKRICKQNEYDLVIDGCAGSGILGRNGKLIEGSPIILSKLSKEMDFEHVSIEIESKTHSQLVSYITNFWSKDNKKIIRGDCNDHIPKILDDRHSILVYLDPFGYGVSPIRRELVLDIAKRENVDLLKHFSFKICRNMGFAKKHLRNPNSENYHKAREYKKSLDIYWGNEDWIEFVGNKKSREYAEEYAEPFRKYKTVQIIDVPRYRTTKFFLIFATNKNPLKFGLMKYVE